MWNILENKKEATKILDKAPKQVQEKYEFWKQLIEQQGPSAVRDFPRFKDETLKGAWKGYRSSRLNEQYRVIYRIEHKEVTIYVEKVGPHNY